MPNVNCCPLVSGSYQHKWPLLMLLQIMEYTHNSFHLIGARLLKSCIYYYNNFTELYAIVVHLINYLSMAGCLIHMLCYLLTQVEITASNTS